MSLASTAQPKKTTVENILAAAETLFVARSYADVTVDQVAEAAQVTKGAVYHHFPNKEGLYLSMLRTDMAQKSDLHRRAADIGGTCADRLRALTAAFLSLPPTKQRLISLVRRDANIFTAAVRTELVEAYQQALPAHVEAIIRDGIRDGEIIPTDPLLLAWQFIAMFEVLLTPYATQRFGSDEDKLNYVMSVFMHGCKRQGETT